MLLSVDVVEHTEQKEKQNRKHCENAKYVQLNHLLWHLVHQVAQSDVAGRVLLLVLKTTYGHPEQNPNDEKRRKYHKHHLLFYIIPN